MKWICILHTQGYQYYTRTIQIKDDILSFYDYISGIKYNLEAGDVKTVFFSERNDIK